jgi:Ca2+/Na+ antiporter
MEEISTMSLAFHRKPNDSRKISNRQIDFVGWVLFVLSAIAFIIASIGSFWAMCGSVFFLLACLVFIIPFFRKG